MTETPPLRLLVSLQPSDGSGSESSTDIGTNLEKCCFREPLLEGAYRRIYVESPGQPLGLSWSGTLEVILRVGQQCTALRDAILAACGRTKVRLKVVKNSLTAEIEVENVDLKKLSEFFRDVCSEIKDS